jgi:hypothetical protein
MSKPSILISAAVAFFAIFSHSPSAKAEGGCPRGFFPIDGGYCRNIVCRESYGCANYADADAKQTANKYGAKCTVKVYGMDSGMESPCYHWGNNIIPKR